MKFSKKCLLPSQRTDLQLSFGTFLNKLKDQEGFIVRHSCRKWSQ